MSVDVTTLLFFTFYILLDYLSKKFIQTKKNKSQGFLMTATICSAVTAFAFLARSTSPIQHGSNIPLSIFLKHQKRKQIAVSLKYEQQWLQQDNKQYIQVLSVRSSKKSHPYLLSQISSFFSLPSFTFFIMLVFVFCSTAQPTKKYSGGPAIVQSGCQLSIGL